MPTYRYNCGKSVDIGFNDADPCRAILTDHVYTILLIGEGSVTLRVDGQKLKGLAPCLVPLKENQLVEFVSSRRLSAQRLYFDVAFLYRSISFQDIHSGHYRKMTETMDLVPLDAFVAPSRSGSLPLSHHEHQRACHFFAGFQSAILNQSYPRWPCLARQYLNGAAGISPSALHPCRRSEYDVGCSNPADVDIGSTQKNPHSVCRPNLPENSGPGNGHQ